MFLDEKMFLDEFFVAIWMKVYLTVHGSGPIRMKPNSIEVIGAYIRRAKQNLTEFCSIKAKIFPPPRPPPHPPVLRGGLPA